MKNPFFITNTARYGLYLGLALCSYTVLMWLTKLDSQYLSLGQYLDMAVVLVPLGFIFAAIFRQRNRAFLPLWQRVAVAVAVGSVADAIYRPFLYAYHQYLHPEWFSYVLALKQTEMQAAGNSATNIAAAIARLQTAHELQAGMFSGGITSALILPALLALLSLVFIRNRKPVTSP